MWLNKPTYPRITLRNKITTSWDNLHANVSYSPWNCTSLRFFLAFASIYFTVFQKTIMNHGINTRSIRELCNWKFKALISCTKVLVDCWFLSNYLLLVSCWLMVWRKYEEISAPCVEEFCFITANTYKKEERCALACLNPFLFVSYQQEGRAFFGKRTEILNYQITMDLQW